MLSGQPSTLRVSLTASPFQRDDQLLDFMQGRHASIHLNSKVPWQLPDTTRHVGRMPACHAPIISMIASRMRTRRHEIKVTQNFERLRQYLLRTIAALDFQYRRHRPNHTPETRNGSLGALRLVHLQLSWQENSHRERPATVRASNKENMHTCRHTIAFRTMRKHHAKDVGQRPVHVADNLAGGH